MSKAQKIFAGVLAFLLFVLILILAYPNYHDGGNKSIFARSHEAQVEKDEAAKKADQDHPSAEDVQAATTVEQESIKHSLTFTAFKTPAKEGVPGTFDDIKLSNMKENDTISNAITGAAFVINTDKVNTNDPSGVRDGKLKEFFFAKLASPQIVGTFNNFVDGNAIVSISMNGVNKEFRFPYTENANSLKINGSIDIVKDFNAQNALTSIAEACKDLHQNKTWSEVDLMVEFTK